MNGWTRIENVSLISDLLRQIALALLEKLHFPRPPKMQADGRSTPHLVASPDTACKHRWSCSIGSDLPLAWHGMLELSNGRVCIPIEWSSINLPLKQQCHPTSALSSLPAEGTDTHPLSRRYLCCGIWAYDVDDYHLEWTATEWGQHKPHDRPEMAHRWWLCPSLSNRWPKWAFRNIGWHNNMATLTERFTWHPSLQQAARKQLPFFMQSRNKSFLLPL